MAGNLIAKYFVSSIKISGLCLGSCLIGWGLPALGSTSPNELATLLRPSAISSAESRSLPPAPVASLGDTSLHLPPRVAPQVASHLVLRLSERRVYLYDGEHVFAQYPVAIGREGWQTPTGRFTVQRKQADPIWRHPFTGELVPPGPDNPLGRHWVGFWSDGNNVIGFHGTPQEDLIGQAVSHGCVRMRNTDVAALFDRVQVGIPVLVEP